MVAAFDFGTAYSGYALSFIEDPKKIQINQAWNSGNLMSLKTPTCILLTPQMEFHSFGYEAENYYTRLVEDQEHDGWFLFKRFKMFLHNNEGLTREAVVKDVNGRSAPAMEVFAMTIGYMRDHLLTNLQKQTSIFESDIKYVLTVPAIWSDKAKQFMREAGIKAGIDTRRLMLALEPEAASVWCQTIPTEAPGCLSGPGSRYMVIDLGGGTVDVSVHEKLSDDSLKQLHISSGGPWGGCAVDENYIAWLAGLFGSTTLDRFKKEQISDYLEVLREFETKKRTINHDKKTQVTVRIFASLKDIYEECEHRSIQEVIAEKRLSDMVKCLSDKLRIDASIVMEWFQDPIDKIVNHINEILAEPKLADVNTILLVGGFAECELVQYNLKKHIPNKHWVIPEEAGLAVLKGAVRYGHRSGIVTERVASFTYGMNTSYPFDPKIHRESKLIKVNGMYLADNVFGVFVRYGDAITTGHEEKRIITPVVPNETIVNIYISSKPNPQFVDDPGCQKIGSLTVRHPDNEPLENKEFEVTFYFGGTELHVTARMLKNDKEMKAIIDCL